MNERMDRKNCDKTWNHIIKELENTPPILWSYVMALQGPCPFFPEVFVVENSFTCPLRGVCNQAPGNEAFYYVDEKDVGEGFVQLRRRKEMLNCYIQHLINVWMQFFPAVAQLLKNYILQWESVEVEEGARRYIELVNRWLKNESVIMRKDVG